MCAATGEPSRKQVYKMFDRIANRYDLLNHVLSAGCDRRWRRRVAELLPPGDNLHVLDLACGTGDQLIALAASGRVAHGVGIDLAEEMLAIGREKISKIGLEQTLAVQTGDAENLAFEQSAFDAVTIAFGIRNMTDVPRTLREMLRVVKPGGRAIILEFSLPQRHLVRGPYLFYLRHILPRLGAIISGDNAAYRYLNETIETFPHGEAFCQIMRDTGFVDVTVTPLTAGIVSIYRGDKR